MTRIETKEQYDWAMKKIEELLPVTSDDMTLHDPGMMELDLLSGLVSDYEDEHYPIGKPSLVSVLRLRMYEMGLTQKKLAELLGVSAPRITEYLSGKSEPTLKVARTICQKLNIDPAIVLGV